LVNCATSRRNLNYVTHLLDLSQACHLLAKMLVFQLAFWTYNLQRGLPR